MNALHEKISAITKTFSVTGIDEAIDFLYKLQALFLETDLDLDMLDTEVLDEIKNQMDRVKAASTLPFLENKLKEIIKDISQTDDTEKILKTLIEIVFALGSMTDQMDDKGSFEEACSLLEDQETFDDWYEMAVMMLDFSNMDWGEILSEGIKNMFMEDDEPEDYEDEVDKDDKKQQPKPKKDSHDYVISLSLPKNYKGYRIELTDDMWISMVWNFKSEFNVPHEDLWTTAYGDSADGDESIQDRKHLAMMIKGYGWYFGCHEFSIFDLEKKDFFKPLLQDINTAFSTGKKTDCTPELFLGRNGIQINVESPGKIDEEDVLKSFINTESFKKFSSYFQRITGELPDPFILPLNEYEDLDWSENKIISFSSKKKTDSLTKLLKSNNAGISAVKANKLMIGHGLLEERTRPSTSKPGEVKKFKALTKKGLIYGINKENYHNPEEFTPNYFTDSFDQLLQTIGIAVKKEETIVQSDEDLKKSGMDKGFEKYLDNEMINKIINDLNLTSLNEKDKNELFLETLEEQNEYDDYEYRHEACIKLIPIIEAFIRTGADINCADEDGTTPLFYSVITHSLDLVRWCIKRGADVNQTMYGDVTPLMVVCGETGYGFRIYGDISPGQIKIAKYLMTKGALPFKKTKNRRSALTISKKSKNMEMFRLLKTIEEKKPENELTLKEAVFAENVEQVKKLLKEGAKPDQKIDGLPILAYMFTLLDPNISIIRELINAGASTKKPIPNKKNPESDKNTVLHYAARGQKTEAIKLLLENTKEINPVNAKGRTPLHEAVYAQHNPDIVEALLNYNSDPNVRDLDGNTPILTLFYKKGSYNNKRLTILKLLLKSGVDTEVVNNLDENVRTLSMIYPNCDSILKDMGIHINIPSYSGENEEQVKNWYNRMKTALDNKNKNAFTILLDAIKPLPKKESIKLLNSCIRNEQFDIAKQMVLKGTDTETKEGRYTVYELAEEADKKEFIDFLLEHKTGEKNSRIRIESECIAFFDEYHKTMKSADSINELNRFCLSGKAFSGQTGYEKIALKFQRDRILDSKFARLEFRGANHIAMQRYKRSKGKVSLMLKKKDEKWLIDRINL